jgi:cytochrome c5
MKATILVVFTLAIACSSVWADMGDVEDKTQTPKPEDTLKSAEPPSSDSGSLANTPESRGKLLYENHCTSCHESNAHIRANRKVKTFDDITYWVKRWSTELDLKWNADEIADVVHYLNKEYYKLNAPEVD